VGRSPKQSVVNQDLALRQVAERRGWEVIEVYRPGLDQMLKDASPHRFDAVMAWAIDRVGRSLADLLKTS
jgi:DNA invertase Pin-like site-specific DNA recombinase